MLYSVLVLFLQAQNNGNYNYPRTPDMQKIYNMRKRKTMGFIFEKL